MAVRAPRSFGAALVASVLPAVALAQGTTPPAPPAAPTSPATSASPAASAGPPAAAHPQGYGYDDRPRRGGTKRDQVEGKPRHHVAHKGGPVATLPGFEMLPDGGSRLFVEVTQNIPVEEKKVAGTITYVLKGAHVTKLNNENALVTVHFNTPVTRARLIPSGRDLHFIVDLRQNVAPTFKLVPAKDGTAILQIEFPKGDFLPAGGGDAVPNSSGAPEKATKKTPAPKPAT